MTFRISKHSRKNHKASLTAGEADLGRGGLADQLPEGRDRAPAGHPVFEVLPKRDSVFAAGLLEAGEGDVRRTQRSEAGGKVVFGGRVGMLAVGLQVRIQQPDLPPDPGDSPPIRVIEGQQMLQEPLGMDPAQAVNEQAKLCRVVADQADVQVKLRTSGVCSRSAISGSFGWNGGRIIVASTVYSITTGRVGPQLMSIYHSSDIGLAWQPLDSDIRL